MFKKKGVGRVIPVIAVSAMLTGCALPMPVQVASWALDGISFLATDKSLTDHGLSVVAQKDCALWRGLKGDEVCSDYDDAGTVAIAAAEQDIPEEESIAALADFDTAAGAPEQQALEVLPTESHSLDFECY